MNKLLSEITDLLKTLRSIGFSDAIDILIVAAVFYFLIRYIRRNNSIKVANGILILVFALWLSSVMNLTVTNFILRKVFDIGILAVIILFQPEIRRAFEKVGSSKLFSALGGEWGGQSIEHVLLQTVYACEDMAQSRTGALIVFERANRLNELTASGTPIDSYVTSELLKNIFYDKSPLHDGAVVIKEGRLAAAGCMLPLSTNTNISRELGMRHRAGIGASEHSDAVVVIVSEETGGISVAVDGMLKRHLSRETFESLLRRELLPKEEIGTGSWLERLKRKGKQNAEETNDN